jgi:hypothetical protein
MNTVGSDLQIMLRRESEGEGCGYRDVVKERYFGVISLHMSDTETIAHRARGCYREGEGEGEADADEFIDAVSSNSPELRWMQV